MIVDIRTHMFHRDTHFGPQLLSDLDRCGVPQRDLYISTAQFGLDEVNRAEQPLAGGVFRTRVPVPGFAGFRFGG